LVKKSGTGLGLVSDTGRAVLISSVFFLSGHASSKLHKILEVIDIKGFNLKQYFVKLLQYAANKWFALKGVCLLKFSISIFYETS